MTIKEGQDLDYLLQLQENSFSGKGRQLQMGEKTALRKLQQLWEESHKNHDYNYACFNR